MSNQDDHIDSPFDDEINRDPLEKGRATHAGHGAHGGERVPAAQAAGYAPAAPYRNAPRCASCGYDMTGLGDDAGCPECGGIERKRYGNVPRCLFCEYELTGLVVEANCPECGKPIWDSNIQPPVSGMSIASMVCGISALPSCMMYGIPSIILGVLAVVFGGIGSGQFKRGERAGSTRGFVLTGRICGWAALTLSIAGWITIIAVIVYA